MKSETSGWLCGHGLLISRGVVELKALGIMCSETDIALEEWLIPLNCKCLILGQKNLISTGQITIENKTQRFLACDGTTPHQKKSGDVDVNNVDFINGIQILATPLAHRQSVPAFTVFCFPPSCPKPLAYLRGCSDCQIPQWEFI